MWKRKLPVSIWHWVQLLVIDWKLKWLSQDGSWFFSHQCCLEVGTLWLACWCPGVTGDPGLCLSVLPSKLMISILKFHSWPKTFGLAFKSSGVGRNKDRQRGQNRSPSSWFSPFQHLTEKPSTIALFYLIDWYSVTWPHRIVQKEENLNLPLGGRQGPVAAGKG